MDDAQCAREETTPDVLQILCVPKMPIALHLPVEIYEVIFGFVIELLPTPAFETFGLLRGRSVRSTALRLVCRHWNAIVLSLPRLWGSVCLPLRTLRSTRDEAIKHYIDSHTKNRGPQPFDLRFDVSPAQIPRFGKILSYLAPDLPRCLSFYLTASFTETLASVILSSLAKNPNALASLDRVVFETVHRNSSTLESTITTLRHVVSRSHPRQLELLDTQHTAFTTTLAGDMASSHPSLPMIREQMSLWAGHLSCLRTLKVVNFATPTVIVDLICYCAESLEYIYWRCDIPCTVSLDDSLPTNTTPAERRGAPRHRVPGPALVALRSLVLVGGIPIISMATCFNHPVASSLAVSAIGYMPDHLDVSSPPSSFGIGEGVFKLLGEWLGGTEFVDCPPLFPPLSLTELVLSVPPTWSASDLRAVLSAHRDLQHLELERLTDSNIEALDALLFFEALATSRPSPMEVYLSGGPRCDHYASVLNALLESGRFGDGDSEEPRMQIYLDMRRVDGDGDMYRTIDKYSTILIPIDEGYTSFVRR